MAVAHGITAGMIPFCQELDRIGPCHDPLPAHPVRTPEATLLPAERHNGHQPHIRMPHAQRRDSLGSRQIEAHGHAAQKRAEAATVELLEQPPEQCVGLTAVGAVPVKAAVREAAAGSEFMEDISGIMRQRYAFGPDFATSRVSQKNNRTMKNTGIVIASLVGGMILGSALTMLLTPQSGPELRRQIKDFVDEEINRAKQKAAKAQEKVQEKMQEEIDELRAKSAK